MLPTCGQARAAEIRRPPPPTAQAQSKSGVPPAPRVCGVYAEAKLYSGAFQSCQPTKTYSLNSIKSYYNVGGGGRCMVLMDDSVQNAGYASAIGTGWVKVDPNVGLQRSDWTAAQAQFDSQC